MMTPSAFDPLFSILEEKGYFDPNFFDRDFLCKSLQLEDELLGASNAMPPDDNWSTICFGKDNAGRSKAIQIQLMFNIDYVQKEIKLESINFVCCNKHDTHKIVHLTDIPSCADLELKLFRMRRYKQFKRTPGPHRL
ncbi:hypothetical protein WJU16_03155 [Chitinophaga pollutisoli]|uniref:Uncharacterized protein n=1 Tax=Chitinophaga pollutisoli TaxID=3133966 RepID=A0ABZ2YT71_9BACT